MFIQRKDSVDNLYKNLQDSSIKMLQELSGNVWTDFNPHDPGITILDILNYALLEIQYICDFDFADYLKNIHNNSQIDYKKLGLFDKEQLFASPIVTAEDYENLFINSFDEIISCKIELDKNHKYIINIDIKNGIDKKRLRQNIEYLYHANRNLCENLGEIKFTKINKSKNNIAENDEFPSCKPNHDKPKPIHANQPEYYSIQNDFPDNYGINQNGMPPNISTEHQTRIMQLQAYLLIFDYLLSGTIFQINNIPQLLDFSHQIPFSPIPNINIENIEKLININKKNEINVVDEDFLHRQKSYILDILDIIYGEVTKNIFTNISTNKKNEKRINLIRLLLEFHANRFRAFNILNPLDDMFFMKKVISALSNSNLDYNSFYFIEHILFKTDDWYKLSIIILDKNYDKKIFENLLYERLPAHLQLNFVWLDEEKIQHFRKIYFLWRQALAKKYEYGIEQLSSKILELIESEKIEVSG